ncbi:MAG: fused MFS/spermidine synthase, partial [Dokdonella sp.]
MRRLRSGDGAILGGLYFTNSIGAAFGALFATFVLLPAVGMPGAMRFGAILNVLVALAAFLLSRTPETPVAAPSSAGATADRSSALRLLLVAAFITGATSFVYEIGWVRMLSVVFGSTVHTFELMLAAFIGGLAFGGLWIRRRIDGYAAPIRVGGWVQILMGLAALLSLILYDHSFDWVAWFMRALSRTDRGYDLYNVVTASVSVLLMAPAAFFAGMTLPLFTMALMRAGGGEAAVGRIYAANTIGAIVGVFAAVHLLIPVLGLKLAMTIAAAGDLVLGLALLRREGNAAREADFRYLGALAMCGAALAATLLFARFDPLAMAGGVYRNAIARLSEAHGEKILYYRDGKTASIALRASADGTRAISTNGKVDAGIRMNDDGKPSPDEITMVMAAGIPLLHHPHPRNAAVIGFGSGLSTHTLLGDPRLERVDTIEIEPAMIEGARGFGEYVERAYNDPRSHIHIEDARTYFAANHARYDIILSEPSNPWVSGVASLFSREFYDFVPHHLAPGGLYVQWMQLYEINDELVASVVQALSEKFRDYRIYLAYNNDMLIVARADGPIEDIHAEALLAPLLQKDLKRQDIGSVAEVLSHQLGDR